ncbi:MAG TPA: hypothetical protein VH575_28560 [Gemmataceae bacterium]|jgi:hypothetical protein
MTTDVVVRALAVVGGGVLGGLGLGLLVQLLARVLTTKKLPRGPALVVRLLSGVICGWLIALWLFGGGGPGIGGAGGWGFGSGTGKGDGEKTAEVAKKDGEGKQSDGETKTPAEETLRIEVLGDDTLKKAGMDTSRRYRVEVGEGSRLLIFDEIKEEIKNRLRQQPPLRRVEIVVYKDSPDEGNPHVEKLKVWAGELDDGKMKVDISKPDAFADEVK